ncbi:hypothetical protein ES703_72175 [subsurface metagenome]
MSKHTPLQTWQLEQIEMECALLTGHATDPSCPCESDTENCIRKHLLTIEALAKEAYPMLDDPLEKCHMSELADQARAWRKQIEQINFEDIEDSTIEDPEPAGKGAPIRTEQLDDTEVRIYKEKGEFYASSFRTIKPSEKTLVLVGCPKDSALWQEQECVCRDTGERGCMELHSIKKISTPN